MLIGADGDNIDSVEYLGSVFLFYNQLTRIPDCIKNLTSLNNLFIGINPITLTKAGNKAIEESEHPFCKLLAVMFYSCIQFS